MLTLDLQTADDSRDIVHRTVQALVEGKVVGIPTDTTYVLAAHSLREAAVNELVGYGHIEVSFRSRESACDFLAPASETTRRLMRRCWPGPLSIIAPCNGTFSATRQLPKSVEQQILVDATRACFRVADYDILQQIHRFLSAPILMAPLRDPDTDQPLTTADKITESISERLPLLLDDGPTRYGGETTIVAVSGNQWKVVREGVIEHAAMNQFVKPVIAIVCTGNTCRSPMAETLLREQLRKRIGSEDAVRVLSAGVAAGAGMGASPQAVEVMGNRGLDLTGHSSRPLDDAVMNVADLILTMTRGHQAAILAAWPDMHDRVFTLRRDGGDITDPVGLPVDVYESCAEQIDQELEKWLDSLDNTFFPQAINEDQ